MHFKIKCSVSPDLIPLWISEHHVFTFRYFFSNGHKWSGQMYRCIRLCTERHPYRLNFIWINRRGVWWRKTKSNASLTLVENGRNSWGTAILDVVVCALHSVKSLLQISLATSQYSRCILSSPILQHPHSTLGPGLLKFFLFLFLKLC